MDGTFGVPPQFCKLYTVHGLRANRTIPCAYALLPNKQEATYNNMCTQIRAVVPGAPQSVVTYFEKGAINAVADAYPGVDQRGCLYHLTSNIYKNVQNRGLQPLYNNDNVFRQNIQFLSGLPLVPLADVIDSFDTIVNNCGVQEQPILDYFEHTYIGTVRARIRQNPMFAIDFWNLFDRVGELPRTNNAVEGWHNAFSQSFPARNPDIWTIIRAIKKEEALVRMAMGQIAAGVDPPLQKRVYRRINENLFTVVGDYHNRQRLDYLRGISYNLYRR